MSRRYPDGTSVLEALIDGLQQIEGRPAEPPPALSVGPVVWNAAALDRIQLAEERDDLQWEAFRSTTMDVTMPRDNNDPPIVGGTPNGNILPAYVRGQRHTVRFERIDLDSWGSHPQHAEAVAEISEQIRQSMIDGMRVPAGLLTGDSTMQPVQASMEARVDPAAAQRDRTDARLAAIDERMRQLAAGMGGAVPPSSSASASTPEDQLATRSRADILANESSALGRAAADLVNDFTRTRLREDGILWRMIRPVADTPLPHPMVIQPSQRTIIYRPEAPQGQRVSPDFAVTEIASAVLNGRPVLSVSITQSADAVTIRWLATNTGVWHFDTVAQVTRVDYGLQAVLTTTNTVANPPSPTQATYNDEVDYDIERVMNMMRELQGLSPLVAKEEPGLPRETEDPVPPVRPLWLDVFEDE